MLSFSEFKNTRELCELAVRYNLDLSFLNEAVNSAGPNISEDQFLNEFFRQAWNALTGGAKAGGVAAAQNFRLTPQQTYDDVMKNAAKLQQSLKTFGLDDAKIENMIRQITNFVTKQYNARGGAGAP